jgi:Tfp pilus assembly protein PilF
VAQLSHPLTGKDRRLLQKIESYFKVGQRAKAKEQLANALKKPATAPYAHAIVGTEYLKEGQPRAAVPELEDAARVLSSAGIHSNLGYALCMTGQPKRGEQELEEALRLDGNSLKARLLMGILLLNQTSREQDAHYNLSLAQKSVRSAHLALAVYHLRRGEKDAAEEQVHEYLGPQRSGDFPMFWQWVSEAAEQAHPAVAFGFRDGSQNLN